MRLVGLLDHSEQGLLLRPGIDDPVGVEDLVTAMSELAWANIINSTSVGCDLHG